MVDVGWWMVIATYSLTIRFQSYSVTFLSHSLLLLRFFLFYPLLDSEEKEERHPPTHSYS